MDSIQRLRHQVQKAGSLKTTTQQRVLVQEGFAPIAWPATYGASGIMSFIVNQDGIVFQKDLGADTAKIAAATKLFDPDLSWSRVDIVN